MIHNGKTQLKKWFHSFIGPTFILELLVGVTLFIIFKPAIDTLLIDVFEGILEKVESGILPNISWIILSIIIVCGFGISHFKPQWHYPSLRVSPKATLILVSISVLYCTFYRFSTNWTFIGWDNIKYADILPIFTICNFLSWTFYFFQSNTIQKNTGFIEDLPYLDENISKDFEDLFLYGRYAQKVAGEIVNTFPRQSFTIGINGEWGSGKTSFINMVAENVKILDPKITLLRFNAWESYNAKQIIPDFLDELKNKVGIGNSFLAKKIGQYSEKLSPVDNNWLKTIVSFFLDKSTISTLKVQISHMLMKSNRRILVLIDDLDRLDTDELMAVFRLVRNSINFSNVIFILAYDKGYLKKATKKRNEYKPDKFLEKIVSSEFSLPLNETDGLRNKLKSELLNFISTLNSINEEQKALYYKEIEEAINSTRTLYINEFQQIDPLKGIVTNPRDITRIVNGLIVNLPEVLGEVSLKDFILLEILRIKYSKIYSILQNSHDKLLSSSLNSENYLTLKSEEETKPIVGGQTYTILKELFPINSYTNFGDPYKLQIRYKSNYFTYFRTSLRATKLSHVEYIGYRNNTLANFKKKIKLWVDQGLEDELSSHFSYEESTLFDNTNQFKNVLEGIIYFASLPSKYKDFYFVGFRDVKIRYWILDIDHSISSKYFGSEKEMKKYIEGVLRKDERDWNWGKSNIVNKMKELSENSVFRDNHWLFSRAELLKLNIHYLRRALDLIEPKCYNRTILYLFAQCIDFNKNTREISKESKEILLTYLKQNDILDQYFLSLLGRSITVGADFKTAQYTFQKDWETFFKDVNELTIAIEKTQMQYKDEYLRFLKDWYKEPTIPSNSINYKFSQGFMEHLDTFWKNFSKMPEMIIP